MRIRTMSALFVTAVTVLVMGFGCKKEDQTQGVNQGQYPQGTTTGQYPQQYPQQPYPTATATATPTATGGAPAAGMPCSADTDPHCLFAKCLNGRCGGCTSAADCKAGATCMQTPLGMACFPGTGAAGTTTAPPPN